MAANHKTLLFASELMVSMRIKWELLTRNTQNPRWGYRETEPMLKGSSHLIGLQSEVDGATTRHGLQPCRGTNRTDRQKSQRVRTRAREAFTKTSLITSVKLRGEFVLLRCWLFRV